METDIRKTINQWRLKKGTFPSSGLHRSSGCYSTATKSRKEPKAREHVPRKKLMFASSPPPIQHEETSIQHEETSIQHEETSIQHEDTFVEEPKFKSVEVQTDFSFVDTLIYFPSNEEAIVNIDHDYSILPSVTNSLASISISFSHFQDKVKQQFEEINKLKLKVTNLQDYIEILLSKRFSVDMIKHDNDAVHFYTGFPNYSSLLAVFEYVESKFEKVHYWQGPCSLSLSNLSYQKPKECSKPGPKRKLKLIDEFFLVLVRLKSWIVC